MVIKEVGVVVVVNKGDGCGSSVSCVRISTHPPS